MIRFLAFLWSGCWHKWETIQVGTFEWSNDLYGSGVGAFFHERCTKCGVNHIRKNK